MAISSSASQFLAERATFAPKPAILMAQALPIPDDAPVIHIRRSFNNIILYPQILANSMQTTQVEL
ncbi:hypothetical protein [Endozoicomonas sp. SCSIO W0465]|uniref:hypothetical protein n=1 Tax=Endozoicomonas sp. SCSIO W0465 TaxID=2918516 RepID=UPI00207560EE|nr:hypothetical protein [Endozoicomonas sp. SCSIO W0465]USE39887.1 hypothetical protein MJO57_28505 [Endozoicomonas sp. SCSIO W0465]